MDNIRQWLNNGKRYLVGLALCKTYCKDPNFIDVLEQGESKYRLSLMEERLRAIMKQKPTHATPLPQPTPSLTITPTISSAPKQEELVKKDDPYLDKWRPLFLQMNALRHQLRTFPNDEERGRAAFKILELEEKVQYYWALRDYYQKYGHKDPEAEAIAPTSMKVVDMNKLEKRRRTVRTYVSRYKRLADENPDKITYRDKLNEYEKELFTLNQQLDG